MHAPKRPHLSTHRYQRLILWTLAMLSWIASVVLAGCRIDARRSRQRGHVSIAGLRRWILQLIVLRAAEIARPRRRHPLFWRGRDERPTHLFRSLIGAALRRALTRKNFAESIRLFLEVLRNLDVYATGIVKRMRRHLTRLWPIALQPTRAAPLPDAPIFPAAITDSS